jgi:hypothetical protein
MTDPPVFIPVYHRGKLVDYAWVDALDAPRVTGYRWTLCWPHAYAGRRLDLALPALRSTSMHRFLLALAPGHGVVHHINEDGIDNRRINLKWLPDILAHGFEPHPRRDLLCSPYKKNPPPHERQIALDAIQTTKPAASLAKATAGFTNAGG